MEQPPSNDAPRAPHEEAVPTSNEVIIPELRKADAALEKFAQLIEEKVTDLKDKAMLQNMLESRRKRWEQTKQFFVDPSADWHAPAHAPGSAYEQVKAFTGSASPDEAAGLRLLEDKYPRIIEEMLHFKSTWADTQGS